MSQESKIDSNEMEGLVQKRRREFSSKDESLNLSKYRKLTTEQKLNDLKKEVTASGTSSYESEEEDDESCVDGDKKGLNNEIVPDSDEQQENSHLSNETNTPSTMEQDDQNSMETGSESDEISATAEINLLENIRKPIEKVQRLAFISATYRISGRKMNTSQFSCNADLTVNGDPAHNEAISRTVKKRNSALYDNDKTDERVEANSPNGCEETGLDNTVLEKAESINTQDLADTQIMDSQSIAALDCMDTAKDVQPQNIKSEKALQVIVAENVETFTDNTCSESETMVPQNTGSEFEETMSENIDSGYKVSSCEDTSMNSIEPTKVTKVEYLNTQDLPDTQMMNSKSIAELNYMDTENILKSDNIKTEIASQITVPANADPQNIENFSENIDSESRKSVLENVYSENEKAVLEDIDSGYENAASEKVDSENEKTLAQEVEKEPEVIENVENSETVLRNINSENIVERLDVVDAVDTTNAGSITKTSNSENMPVLLTDSNSNNDAQTESMDVETSVIENTETNIAITKQSYVNESFASDNSNRPQNNENEQDAAIRNLLSHANFDIITADSQVVSEVIIPDNTEVYTEPNNSSNPPTYEHSYQDPNTTGVVEEVITDASRANSVSDLNLAQLVLSMKQDIQELCKKVDQQGNVLEAVVNANKINLTPLFAQTFQEKHNLQIPFTKIEDFDKFNQDLAKNTRFCNEFITSLCSYINNNVTLTKNILNMLRIYMSKELATLYTASKATGNKMVLKDTLFCKCLLQATKLTIRNGLLPLEHEKVFMKSLGLVISGAKNWVTHEDERRRSSQS